MHPLLLDCLVPRCYLKLGDWCTQLDERHMTSSTINAVLQFFQKATEHDRSWYKAWHSWAFMNFQALLEQKRLSASSAAEANGEISAHSKLLKMFGHTF